VSDATGKKRDRGDLFRALGYSEPEYLVLNRSLPQTLEKANHLSSHGALCTQPLSFFLFLDCVTLSRTQHQKGTSQTAPGSFHLTSSLIMPPRKSSRAAASKPTSEAAAPATKPAPRSRAQPAKRAASPEPAAAAAPVKRARSVKTDDEQEKAPTRASSRKTTPHTQRLPPRLLQRPRALPLPHHPRRTGPLPPQRL
jgi:hypothetical protein